ncbi:MAG: efflux RND transporter periplasmic adaptor subunit [Acidobacteriota bacterium]
MKKTLIFIIILIVIAALIFLPIKLTRKKIKNDITWVKVKKGDIVEKALAIGKIEPEHEISIKSKISGIAKKIYVEVGDKVDGGDSLIEISPDPTPLEYAEAKRQVELAQVERENKKSEYERAQKLMEKNFISQKDFELTKRNFEEADLKLKLSSEKLSLIERGKAKIAERNVESVIKSPVSGTILEKLVNEGDPVVPLTFYQAGTELLKIANMNSLLFKGTVDEIDVGKLREGMRAIVKIGALPDKPVEGILKKISPKAKKEENATLFDVEIEVKHRNDVVIRAGYSANAEIVTRKSENTLYIPERLVEFKEDKTFVEIRGKDRKPGKKEIKVGLSDGINIEVLEGLREGEEIAERPPKEIK